MRSLSIRPGYTAALLALLAFVAGILAQRSLLKHRPVAPPMAREMMAGAPPQSRFGWFHDFHVQLWQANPRRGDVVLLGDSLTQYGAWDKLLPGVETVNQGIGGDKLDGLIARIEAAYVTGARTAVVTIGTNDIVLGKIDPDRFFAKWTNLIAELHGHGLAVVVTSIPATMSATFNSTAFPLNARMQAHCAAGACRYVDLNATLAPSGLIEGRYTLDGLHFTVGAYRAWAALLAPDLLSN